MIKSHEEACNVSVTMSTYLRLGLVLDERDPAFLLWMFPGRNPLLEVAHPLCESESVAPGQPSTLHA